jgi:hypothetical protein
MQHEPELRKDGNEFEYRDGDVHAIISTDLKSFCQIHEFSSKQPGKGNGRAAVAWMKQQYREVHVCDPGNEIDAPDAFKFWCKLVDSGLIAGMIDGDSNPIYADGQWITESLDPEDYPDLRARLSVKAQAPV